jgi:hypothetical protein
MKKNIIYKIFLFFLFLIVLFLKPSTVKAQNLEVTCDGSGSCTLSSTDPLFSIPQDSYWYPGKSIAKTLRITNNNPTDTTTVSTNAKNLQINSSPCQLDKQLLLSIVGPAPLNSVVWAGSLNAFYQQAPLPLAVFSPSSFGDFIFTVALPIGVGNECQNQTTSFDLLLNFSGETTSPIPTPTPTSTPGGGGAVLGTGVSAPTCNDTIPGGAPTLISAVGGVNSVTLTWTLASNPVSYYLVTYGTTPGAQTYGNPNIGGQGTTSYTVNGLSGGQTYYFRVRAGNGCMPGPYSNELSTGVGGGVLAGPAAGFIPGVLGTTTQSSPEPIPTPTAMAQVLGTECVKNIYPWWIFLVLELAVILLILRRGKINKWKFGKLIISLVAIAALSQIAHEITGCNCITSIWCSKYVWINLAILLFSSAYTLYSFSRKNR